MREECDNSGKRFDCHWEGMKNLVGTEKYSSVDAAIISANDVFNVQGTWNSPDTFPTMVHGQAFRTKRDLTTPRGHPLSATWIRKVGFIFENIHQYQVYR